MRRAIAVFGVVAVLATLATVGDAQAEGRGYTPKVAPERYFVVANHDAYFITLVRNSQGDIEQYRQHAQRAAAVIARYTGMSLVVRAGTSADGASTDLQPGLNEIMISIDATSPCGSNWEAGGCTQTRMVKERSPEGSEVYMVQSARTWLRPVTGTGASVYGLRHLIAHHLGHAMGLDHYDEIYQGKPQTMHAGIDLTNTNVAYGDYQTGDIRGFSSLHPYGRPWEFQGGAVVGDPDVASWAPGRLDVFVRGTDNALYHKFYDGSWHAFAGLGGALTSSPTAVSWGPNRIDVFAKGDKSNLIHKWWDGNAWSGWEDLGGSISSAPDVASWAPGRLDVFARGTSGELVSRAYQDGWSPWFSFAGQTLGGPGAVSPDTGVITVVTRTPGKSLIFKTFHRTWTDWAPIPSPVSTTSVSDPDISSWAPGQLDVFAVSDFRSEINQYSARDGLWTGTAQVIPRPVSSGVGAVSWGPNRIDWFATTPSGGAALAHRWWDGYSW
jgi:hypothetical protein